VSPGEPVAGPLLDLAGAGLAHRSHGIMGWSAALEEVFTGLDRALTRWGREPGMRVLRFPPVMRRADFERSQFVDSFPQLFGSVHAFSGGRGEHQELRSLAAERGDWGHLVGRTDYVLVPAACYPVYPLLAGELDGPVTVDVGGWCFRHEPSEEPGRLVAFRQREFVAVGDEDAARRWFAGWQRRAASHLAALGLPADLEPASDPFFGTGGRLLASSQREQGLKFELLAPVGAERAAVVSCNYHGDHFGAAFDIRAGGAAAHSACVGFGLERIALALLTAHGPRVEAWPPSVRDVLWS
jgi:seryl-tRNA synthetase